MKHAMLQRAFPGCRSLVIAVVALSVVQPISAQRPIERSGYDIDFIGPPLADPLMQHAKETYVLFGCAYCHGIDLRRGGEAADLMHSALVGADVDGTAIVAVLRAGIPQTTKLSPMPQFSDLSDRQLHDIARYIHYARQQGRFEEIVNAEPVGGRVAAGKEYFEQNCSGCHANDFAGIDRRYAGTALRDQLLRPASLQGATSYTLGALNDARTRGARRRHNAFLENSTPTVVADLVAFLRTK